MRQCFSSSLIFQLAGAPWTELKHSAHKRRETGERVEGGLCGREEEMERKRHAHRQWERGPLRGGGCRDGDGDGLPAFLPLPDCGGRRWVRIWNEVGGWAVGDTAIVSGKETVRHSDRGQSDKKKTKLHSGAEAQKCRRGPGRG